MRTDRPVRHGAKPDRQQAPQPRPIQGELLYGRNGVLESLRGRRTPKRLLLAAGIKEDERTREAAVLANRWGVPIEHVQRSELDTLTAGANHQGIALMTSHFPYVPLDDIAERSGTILVLDHIQDTQNVGTLLRAAEAVGVAGVVLARDRAAEITPATVNASAGAVEHLLIAREPNLVRSLENLKKSGRWAIALDTGPRAIDLFSGDWPLPAVLVVGSEGEGLTPLVKKACDLVVEIPMEGNVASLNAATAGSIALFELFRRSRATA